MGSHTKNKSDASGDSCLHQRRSYVPHSTPLPPKTHSSQNDIQKSNKPASLTLVLPRWLYCYLPVVTIVVVPFLALWLASCHYSHVDNLIMQKMDSVGWEMVDLFGNFDLDGDVHLSFEEALPLIELMSEYKKVLNESALKTNISAKEQVIELKANFTPVVLSSMTKDWAHDINNNYSFHGLFEWKSPNVPYKDFGVSLLLDLCPPNLRNVRKPGTTYRIISPPSHVYNVLPAVGRSTRHFPPQPSGKGRALHSLLSMFHPQPFIIMRFSPQGAMGCVRAVSDTHVHIVFRIHAEFQLNEPPRDPFWFTPAQFRGSLLVTRDGTRVEHFHMYVPADRNLNVDMEWLTAENNPDSMEVDIGYMPFMDMASTGPSRPQSSDRLSKQDEALSPEHIKWNKEISEEAAYYALDLEFYPFKQVKYYNMSEAFDHATATDKLVHSVLLWGALDDQSC